MLRIDPTKHLLLDINETILGKDLYREFGSEFPNLFLYYHTRTRNYVVAEWIVEGSEFVELMVIGHFLSDFSYDDKEFIAAKMYMNQRQENYLYKLEEQEYEALKHAYALQEKLIEQRENQRKGKISVGLYTPDKRIVLPC